MLFRSYCQILLVFLSALSFAVLMQVLPAGRMAALFVRFGNFEKVPFPKAAAHSYASSIAGYLLGWEGELSMEYDGTDYTVYFSEKELRHMEDVRVLFQWLQSLFFGSFFLSLLHWKRYAPLIRKEYASYLRSLAFCIGLLSLLCAVAVFQFEALFIGLHRVLFANEDWLLTPGKDVIISLMPIPFFVEIAKSIALSLVLFVTVYSLAMRFVRIR